MTSGSYDENQNEHARRHQRIFPGVRRTGRGRGGFFEKRKAVRKKKFERNFLLNAEECAGTVKTDGEDSAELALGAKLPDTLKARGEGKS